MMEDAKLPRGLWAALLRSGEGAAEKGDQQEPADRACKAAVDYGVLKRSWRGGSAMESCCGG